MKFSELVDQAIEFLRQRERVSYRALKREFDLDDESLEDLKAELIDAQRIAADEDGKVLVWTGKGTEEEAGNQRIEESGKSNTKVTSSQSPVVSSSQPPASQTADAGL